MNIELELVADVNLDLALRSLAATLIAGRRTHRSGTWRTKSIEYHIGRARRHLELIAVGETSEDHLSHAVARLAMALELCERAGHAAAPLRNDAEQEPSQMGLFNGSQATRIESLTVDTAFGIEARTSSDDMLPSSTKAVPGKKTSEV